MRRAGLSLVMAAGLAAAVVVVPAGASYADTIGSGQGSYTVEVRITGSGVGSGGSLGGPAVAGGSSGGGSVAVRSPCGIKVDKTQQQVELANHNSKQMLQDYIDWLDAIGGGLYGGQWVLIKLAEAQLASWGKTGLWYYGDCDGSVDTNGTIAFAAKNPPTLVGPGGAAAPPVPSVDPKLLEDIARRAMTLPTPAVAYNPTNQGYVNLATWVWVTPLMSPTTTREVTASAGGRSATVVATYHGTDFSADGGGAGQVSCADGGRPYSAGASSACTLTFDRSGGFTVTGSSHWSAVSRATGIPQHPIDGADMVGQVGLPVAEIQTVVTR